MYQLYTNKKYVGSPIVPLHLIVNDLEKLKSMLFILKVCKGADVGDMLLLNNNRNSHI